MLATETVAGWRGSAGLSVEAGATLLRHLHQSASALERLLMACAMGGAVGLEREWRHKDSGLRTNMLLCMGAALFTIMSQELAGAMTPDKSRIASNIVQGVGFLGAGLILHTKNRVLGLTSAATVFVVAAVGMTCGAGLFVEALFATILLLLALQAVGQMETRLGRKRISLVYEVRARIATDGQGGPVALEQEQVSAEERMTRSVLDVLDRKQLRLQIDGRDRVAGLQRVTFSILATQKMHTRLLAELRASMVTDQVLAFRVRDEE
jgi:putative Mg2+ transporter-C (MgtC) family protein